MVVANSSLFGNVCSLLPIWVAPRDLGDNFLVTLNISDLNVVPKLGSRQCLWDTPGHSSQSSPWPAHHIHLCRIRNVWLRSCVESNSGSLTTGRYLPQRGGVFTKFNANEFDDVIAEKWLISDGCGVKYIPNCGLLDTWHPCTSWGLPLYCPASHQIMFCNKSHILCEKTKKQKDGQTSPMVTREASKVNPGIHTCGRCAKWH